MAGTTTGEERNLVTLPIHLKWSGPREFDAADPKQRCRVYEIVLREGGASDIRTYIDPVELARLWTDLVLPAEVRLAWADYFELRRGIRLSRLRDAEPSTLGPVLSLEDLAADKLLALFGRAEARDFVDVFLLCHRLSTRQVLGWAGKKDPGFDPYVLATMIGHIGRHDRREFELDDAAYREMALFYAELRATLIADTLSGGGETG